MPPDRLLFVGGWGHHYLRGLVAAGSIDVVAAACGDGFDDMARLIPDQVPAVGWCDDPDRALAEFEPDVVSVGAVYGRNGIWVQRCLEAGVAVVSDKPIAADDAQLDRLREVVAARTDARLVTELPARADAAFRTARQVVTGGGIGDPVLLTAQKSYPFGSRPDWYDDPTLYPGTELWVATHAFDFAQFVTGQRMVPVAGRSANVALSHMPSVDDHSVTVARLEGGGTAVIHADYLRPPDAHGHADDRLRVAGSSGVVEVRSGRCWLLTDGDPVDVTEASLACDPATLFWRLVHDDATTTSHSMALAETVLAARRFSRGRSS